MRMFVRNIPYKAFQIPERSGSLQIVTPEFVKESHSKDIAVHVWTINNKPDMERLLDMEVDGIFTDFPAVLRDVLEERGLL